MGIQRDKLERSLGGIADMKKIPDMIFIIDTNVEDLAVKEASKLNIPIVAIVDTNSDPVGINFPIPGNDDARRAINLYCDLIKQTIIDAKSYIIVKESQASTTIEKTEKSTPKKSKENFKFEEKNKIAKNKNNVTKKKSTSILEKIKSLASKK